MMQLATSTARIFIPLAGPAGVDLTQFPIGIALVAEGLEPGDGDYHDADWLAPEAGQSEEASLMVGSGEGGVAYPAGDYMAFARVTTSDEVVALKAGRVRIGDSGN